MKDYNTKPTEKEIKEVINDSLTNLISSTIKVAVQEAVNKEMSDFISMYSDLKLDDGKQQIVRNGYNPERSITTGVGEIKVKMPKSRDRKSSGINFSSSLLPKYMRRTKSIDELLPVLYLLGISTSNFQTALAPILGEQAKNVSPNVICNLKKKWAEELDVWRKRSLKDKKYVYWWVDGIYL